jgi:hypothetical protein
LETFLFDACGFHCVPYSFHFLLDRVENVKTPSMPDQSQVVTAQFMLLYKVVIVEYSLPTLKEEAVGSPKRWEL